MGNFDGLVLIIYTTVAMATAHGIHQPLTMSCEPVGFAEVVESQFYVTSQTTERVTGDCNTFRE